MGAATRRLTLAAALSLVLTSCGLALASTRALAPDEVATAATEDAATPAAAVEPAAPAAPAEAVAPEPLPAVKPALPAAAFGVMKWVSQTLNNCGPAAVVMALSTLGVDESQEVARLALRGTDVRRGMGPGPVGPWVQDRFGLRSIWRTNGTTLQLKTLVTNGFAPMVTQWMVDPEIQRVSHWRTVRGYDDAKGVFYVNDPMLGNNVALSYEWFERNWQPFSYRYMVLYRPSDEALVKAMVGSAWDDNVMRKGHYDRAKDEALARPTSASWLAFGEAAYQYGMFDEAVAGIEKGLSLGSGTGVFMLRSSLPNALRALGRFTEADAAQQRLAGITPGVSPASGAIATTTSATFRLDPAIAKVIDWREANERAWAAAERRLIPKLARDLP